MHDLHEGVLEEFAEASRKGNVRQRMQSYLRERLDVVPRTTRDYSTEYMRRRTRARAYQRDYEQKKRWERGVQVTHVNGSPRRTVWFFTVGVLIGKNGAWTFHGPIQNDNSVPWTETRIRLMKRRAI